MVNTVVPCRTSMLCNVNSYNIDVFWTLREAILLCTTFKFERCTKQWSTKYKPSFVDCSSMLEKSCVQIQLCRTLFFNVLWIQLHRTNFFNILWSTVYKSTLYEARLFNVLWNNGLVEQIFWMLYESTVYEAPLYESLGDSNNSVNVERGTTVCKEKESLANFR